MHEIELMVEKVCNLWIEPADFRCIPTSGAVSNGEAIMDEGIALEATKRFQSMPADLGRLLTSRGNHVHEIRPGVLSFPIKQYNWSSISLELITRSVSELSALVGKAKVLLPRPPLGDGDPTWDQVKAVLTSLPDNVVVIQHH